MLENGPAPAGPFVFFGREVWERLRGFGFARVLFWRVLFSAVLSQLGFCKPCLVVG
jgi:hypothetical protein